MEDNKETSHVVTSVHDFVIFDAFAVKLKLTAATIWKDLLLRAEMFFNYIIAKEWFDDESTLKLMTIALCGQTTQFRTLGWVERRDEWLTTNNLQAIPLVGVTRTLRFIAQVYANEIIPSELSSENILCQMDTIEDDVKTDVFSILMQDSKNRAHEYRNRARARVRMGLSAIPLGSFRAYIFWIPFITETLESMFRENPLQSDNNHGVFINSRNVDLARIIMSADSASIASEIMRAE